MAKQDHRTRGGISRRSFLKTGVVAGAGFGLTAGGLLVPPYVRASDRTVRFWTWLDPNDPNPRSQVQNAQIERFEQSTGIRVQVELVDWRTLSQQLMRAVVAGEGPDVVRLYSAWLPEHVAAGNIVALDDHLNAWPAEKLADIGPPLIQFDGATMAMYVENRMYMLYYRTDMMAEVGVDTPRTFDEVARAAGAIANDRRAGLIWPASTRSTDTFSYATPMIWAQGGDLVGPDKRALFNGEGGVRFYSWLRDLVHEHGAMPPSYISWDEEQLQQAVNSGTCAMALMGTNRVVSTRRALSDAPPEALQVTHAPSVDGSPPPVPVAGWTVAMARTVRDPEAAFQFIDILTDTEAQTQGAKLAGEMPVRTSTLADPWFDSPEAAEMRGWIEYIAAHGRGSMAEKLVRARELNTFLNRATQEIITRGRPVQEALDDAAEQWNRIAA